VGGGGLGGGGVVLCGGGVLAGQWGLGGGGLRGGGGWWFLGGGWGGVNPSQAQERRVSSIFLDRSKIAKGQYRGVSGNRWGGGVRRKKKPGDRKAHVFHGRAHPFLYEARRENLRLTKEISIEKGKGRTNTWRKL